MTKNDLKTGMIVKTRQTGLYLVMKGTGMDETETTNNDVLLAIDDSGRLKRSWNNFNDYSDDLKIAYDDCHGIYDITAVYSPLCTCEIGIFKYYRCIWERQE